MKHSHIILLLFILYAMSSCTSKDDVTPEPKGDYHFDLVISVAREEGMRMANEVVQAEGTAFRGLQSLIAIPFQTGAGAVKADDTPLTSSFYRAVVNRINGSGYYYFIVNCTMGEGTNRLLVYSQAASVAGNTTPAKNGKLVAVVSEQASPADISFSLQRIRETIEVHPEAQALADYLSAIANTSGWSTTTNSELKKLYLDFIHADSEESGLIPGSAANVKEYAKELKTKLTQLSISDDLVTSIIDNIDDTDDLSENTYPGSIGLPDGAAALRWSVDANQQPAFTVRTETTTLDNINGIIRYTYPAELWYYGNSAICTSKDEVSKTTYESSAWPDLLSTYYKDNRFVNGETRSVAIEDPLQYGVGRLQMSLSPLPTSLKDAKNEDISTSGFKLTGVIIGGQHTVGFDFKPVEPQSDLDARFIYDTEVGTTGTVNTLVLQSYDGEKVPVILEFKNETGHSFYGKDGIIYPNTKFYLIGEVDPESAGNKDEATVAGAKGRVFTQDYTTKMTMTVTSLKNAYSCMPDLLTSRLEIGVQVQTQWEQSTTTTVKL